jgi:hypothetical protein
MKRSYDNLPYEFLFMINGNPIVGRNFSVKNFNKESLNSIELKETLEDVVETIRNHFKNKTYEYLYRYYNPYFDVLEDGVSSNNEESYVKDIYENEDFSIELTNAIFKEVIDFYSDQRHEDRVWINPCIKDYYSVDVEGVDYKCLVEDLPLFWKNRISEIKIHQPLNKVIKKARNLALYHSANARKYMNNMMARKGVNWGELREFRNRIPLYYLKKLFNHKA